MPSASTSCEVHRRGPLYGQGGLQLVTRANLRGRIIHVNGFTPMVDVLNDFLFPRRAAASRGILVASLALTACRDAPVSRNGPAQERIVSRTYPSSASDLRAAILQRYAQLDATRSEMFRVLSISEQPPPGFSPDWLDAYVDPGGFLEPYRRLAPADRENDLVLREPTGDRYWLSEYEANGRAAPFHCGLIIHFVERTRGTTEVQVFEVVPTVWVGEHWAMSREGPGFGKYHDIRFVEPTVKDRVAVLELIDSFK
jgi:hypothetical protein